MGPNRSKVRPEVEYITLAIDQSGLGVLRLASNGAILGVEGYVIKDVPQECVREIQQLCD